MGGCEHGLCNCRHQHSFPKGDRVPVVRAAIQLVCLHKPAQCAERDFADVLILSRFQEIDKTQSMGDNIRKVVSLHLQIDFVGSHTN